MKNRQVSRVLSGGIMLVLLLLLDINPMFSPNAFAIMTDDKVQVQGRLTDDAGNAVNSPVNITGAIYDVSTGGTARCTDSDLVTPVNGLFNFELDFCTAADFNGDQLFLGIQVGSDAEMTPRQGIYAVPYAWGLRPGAIVKGADSYIFVPGSALVKNLSFDTTRWDIQINGAARIYRGGAVGNKAVYYPITLPGALYGQSVTLKEVRVYYKATANSFINYTELNLQTDADSGLIIGNDNTDRASTTATSFTIPLTANNVLSSSQGIVSLYLALSFANDTEPVTIGGIRLRLGHQ